MKLALTKKEYQAAYQRVNELAVLDVDFFVLTVFATVICFFGFVMNSPTVIIGGMVISPLLNPIIALSGAIVHGHGRRAGLVTIQLALCFVVVIVLTMILSLFWPVDLAASEIIDRLTVAPMFYLLVGIFCGLSATFAYYWPRVKEAVIGVAISIAIVPPVIMLGISLAANYDLIPLTSVIVFMNIIGVLIGSVSMIAFLRYYLK